MHHPLILYADGRYEIKEVLSSDEYPSLLTQCKAVTLIPPRPERETFFQTIDNTRCYTSESGLQDELVPSVWVEFLDAIGLFDDKIGCLFGDAILVGYREQGLCDLDDKVIDVVEKYHTIVSRKDSSLEKWAHIKELTIKYSLLKACQWHDCDVKDCKMHCKKCKSVMYCSRECQIKDWPKHKEECENLTDDNTCKQQ